MSLRQQAMLGAADLARLIQVLLTCGLLCLTAHSDLAGLDESLAAFSQVQSKHAKDRLLTTLGAQVSLVCKTFGRAAAGVKLSLWFQRPDSTPPFETAAACLSSRLLCSWALVSLQYIAADLELCLGSGLLDMVQASTGLHALDLQASSPAACELACRLIAAAPGLRNLYCRGSFVPTDPDLPLGLENLTVATCFGNDCNVSQLASLQQYSGQALVEQIHQCQFNSIRLRAQLDDLLLQLRRLTALSSLGLDLGTAHGLPGLASLPNHLALHISLQVTQFAPVQLDWLLQHRHVWLEISVETEKPYQHQAVVAFLQQSSTARHGLLSHSEPVRVSLRVPFTEPLQRIWRQCAATFILIIRAQSPCLLLLPRAATLDLRIKSLVQDIAWSAMQGRRIVIHLLSSAQLRADGCPQSIADSSDGPTKLSIRERGLAQAQGFPPSPLAPGSRGVIYRVRTQSVPIQEE